MTGANAITLSALLGFTDRKRIVLHTGGRAFSTADVLEHAQAAADVLSQAPGKRWIVPTADPVSALAALAAARMSGATVVPWRQSAFSAERLICITHAAGILRHDNSSGWVREAIGDAVRAAHDAPGHVILMTSGSTGQPKGVALDLEELVLNASLAGQEFDLAPVDFWSVAGDLSLTSPIAHVLMAWRYGKPVHVVTDMDWKARATLFRSARGGFGGAPLQLMDFAQRLKNAAPAMLVSSGDFLNAPLADAISARFPETTIHKMYGLTEAAGRVCILPHDLRVRHPDAVGRPMPGFSVWLRDVDAQSGIGEIMVDGPLLFHGYWREAEGFVPRGRTPFASGDLGRITPDGIVTVTGRANDSFKVGGEKVDRSSIETALRPLLGNAEFCVLPVPHDTYGHIAALFVATGSPEALPARAAVVAAVRAALPARFVPALMLRAGERLPRLDNGKIDRQKLVWSFSQLESLS